MSIIIKAVKIFLKRGGLSVEDKYIQVPPDPELGDISITSAFKAKEPAKRAEQIAKRLKPHGVVKEVRFKGNYINLFLDWGILGEKIISLAIKEKKGYGKGSCKDSVLIDTFNPNTHKAFHIGHLRNAVLGEAIRRLLLLNGCKVNTVSYIGDTGSHIAKWLWYYDNFYEGEVPKENASKWAQEIYTLATQKALSDESYKEQIAVYQKRLEAKEEGLMSIWKKTRGLCLKDIIRIQKELKIHIDDYFFESEFDERGKEIVHQLLRDDIAVMSKGAVAMDFEDYGLGVFLLLKSNNTSLYSTKDLGLAELKEKKYKFDKSLFVVSSEQEFYFKQLFKTFELMNHPSANKNEHISYALVMLKEGKMSSRQGNIVFYDDLRDQMIEAALKKVKKRNKNISKKAALAIAEKIAFGAMKYGLLRFDNLKQIIFDPDEMLSFEGRTGPYLQYAYVRSSKILSKARVSVAGLDASKLCSKSEISLIKKIGRFPTVVSNAAKKYAPNMIANYAFELAKIFSEFYEQSHVLKAEDPDTKKARLLLVKAFNTVLSNCLGILGIETPEKM